MALVNINTLEAEEYGSIEIVENSTCIIVSDADTGLYGLYDGYDMVYECLYNSIDYYEGDIGSTSLDFELMRGSEWTSYYSPRIQAGWDNYMAVGDGNPDTDNIKQDTLAEEGIPYVDDEDLYEEGDVDEIVWDTWQEDAQYDYILPYSASDYVLEEDIAGLSEEELELARNEIFARHGRRFQTESIREYFLSKSWYQELYEPEEFDANVDSCLNEYEKANIDTILNYEIQMGYGGVN